MSETRCNYVKRGKGQVAPSPLLPTSIALPLVWILHTSSFSVTELQYLNLYGCNAYPKSDHEIASMDATVYERANLIINCQQLTFVLAAFEPPLWSSTSVGISAVEGSPSKSFLLIKCPIIECWILKESLLFHISQ